MNKQFSHNTIAIVYDFDGTLTPLPMQEYTILPEIGIKDGKKFWAQVNAEAKRIDGEAIATYMRLILEKSQAAHYPVTEEKLQKLASKIEYFPGVHGYFKRINKFVEEQLDGEINLRHYIISAGLKEIIAGSSISKYFHKIFASEYNYNEYGAATFPNMIINDTFKTQFIFRINKGLEKLSDNINVHMPFADRVIPFQNILYIGDGLTDVPSMTVIRKNGGYAIAVYQPEKPAGIKICKELLRAQRVDFLAEADYRNSTRLDRLVKLVLKNMAEGIRYAKESFVQSQEFLQGR